MSRYIAFSDEAQRFEVYVRTVHRNGSYPSSVVEVSVIELTEAALVTAAITGEHQRIKRITDKRVKRVVCVVGDCAVPSPSRSRRKRSSYKNYLEQKIREMTRDGMAIANKLVLQKEKENVRAKETV